MSNPKTKTRTPEETLRAIQDQLALDELERVKALTEEQLDEELRADGVDIEGLERRLLEQREKLEAARKQTKG